MAKHGLWIILPVDAWWGEVKVMAYILSTIRLCECWTSLSPQSTRYSMKWRNIIIILQSIYALNSLLKCALHVLQVRKFRMKIVCESTEEFTLFSINRTRKRIPINTERSKMLLFVIIVVIYRLWKWSTPFVKQPRWLLGKTSAPKSWSSVFHANVKAGCLDGCRRFELLNNNGCLCKAYCC